MGGMPTPPAALGPRLAPPLSPERTRSASKSSSTTRKDATEEAEADTPEQGQQGRGIEPVGGLTPFSSLLRRRLRAPMLGDLPVRTDAMDGRRALVAAARRRGGGCGRRRNNAGGQPRFRRQGRAGRRAVACVPGRSGAADATGIRRASRFAPAPLQRGRRPRRFRSPDRRGAGGRNRRDRGGRGRSRGRPPIASSSAPRCSQSAVAIRAWRLCFGRRRSAGRLSCRRGTAKRRCGSPPARSSRKAAAPGREHRAADSISAPWAP